MEPRTVQVLGIRGLRGSPDVLPHQAIGEEQIAAFFAQDGAVVSVRIGLGVCWVEFQDFEGAQRAALRDNTETGGHSLRVALLHPQPPPVLRQRLGAGAAEWQPESSQELGGLGSFSRAVAAFSSAGPSTLSSSPSHLGPSFGHYERGGGAALFAPSFEETLLLAASSQAAPPGFLAPPRYGSSAGDASPELGGLRSRPGSGGGLLGNGVGGVRVQGPPALGGLPPGAPQPHTQHSPPAVVSYAEAAARARAGGAGTLSGVGAGRPGLTGGAAGPFAKASTPSPARAPAPPPPLAAPAAGPAVTSGAHRSAPPTAAAVAHAAASKLPLAAAISTVHGAMGCRREQAQTCVLKMRGLPFSARKQDVMLFFDGAAQLREDSIHIVLEASGRPAGLAFVEFETPEEARAALAGRNRKMMGSRYVELFASSRDEATRVATGGGKW